MFKESTLMQFNNLGLVDPLLQAVRSEGYKVATPIQAKTIPQIIEGRDLMGCAQTGTGKTAAFALPTIQRLWGDGSKPAKQPKTHKSNGKRDRTKNRRSIRALILSPTRELAVQIGESFSTYGRFTDLRHTVVYGGVSQGRQVRALQRGVDTLVATPGRILDLMNQGYIDVSGVEILIFDEADRMLDMGFIHDLRRIASKVPNQRQTLMFSATMPDAIKRLTTEWLKDPVHVQMTSTAAPAEKIEQSVYFVEPKEKPLLLADFLNKTASNRTLVFSRTKHGADKIVRNLQRDGFQAEAIHGNKSQAARQRVLKQFKSDRLSVLVATDVAARGLDVDDISHVINYDMPLDPETYVHRIGRTGRAGASGIAVSFCGRNEQPQLRLVERLIRHEISVERHQFESPQEKDSKKKSKKTPGFPKKASKESHLSSAEHSGTSKKPKHASGKSQQQKRWTKSRRPTQGGKSKSASAKRGRAKAS
jgi:ATP-dependent RNA helicase RhlE